MNKKKIAVVGLGKIGLFHLSILRNLPQVVIAALADPKKSTQGTVKGMGLNLPFYDSVEKMLEDVQVDGVFACVPPAFNLPIAKLCVPKGISLFLEKPMAQNVESAEEILKTLNSAPRKITHAVGYMVAYYPLFQKAKTLIQEGSIGSIKEYTSEMFLGEVLKKQEGWRQNPKISGGGAVAILGSHLLYLLRSLFGPAEAVSGVLRRPFSPENVEDEASDIMFHHKYYNGKFNVSWSREGYSDMMIKIEVFGSDGMIMVTETSLKLIRKGTETTWYPWDIPQKNSCEIQIPQQGYIAQDEDFVSAIGSDRVPLVDWNEGLEVQKMIAGVYNAGQWK